MGPISPRKGTYRVTPQPNRPRPRSEVSILCLECTKTIRFWTWRRCRTSSSKWNNVSRQANQMWQVEKNGPIPHLQSKPRTDAKSRSTRLITINPATIRQTRNRTIVFIQTTANIIIQMILKAILIMKSGSLNRIQKTWLKVLDFRINRIGKTAAVMITSLNPNRIGVEIKKIKWFYGFRKMMSK